MRPRPSIGDQPTSNERHLWQIHSGPHCQALQALQRWMSSSPRRSALPVRRAEPVGLRRRDRQSLGKVEASVGDHSVASDPKMMLLTGGIIGPAVIIETSLRRAWFGESPRTWRTASITIPKPCM